MVQSVFVEEQGSCVSSCGLWPVTFPLWNLGPSSVRTGDFTDGILDPSPAHWEPVLLPKGSRDLRDPRRGAAPVCGGSLWALSVLSAQERGEEVQPAEVRPVGRSLQAASLPLVHPPLRPSQSPAILVPENFLPQFCGNAGIVTHSPPQTILILGSPLSPPLPPTSFSTAALNSL